PRSTRPLGRRRAPGTPIRGTGGTAGTAGCTVAGAAGNGRRATSCPRPAPTSGSPPPDSGPGRVPTGRGTATGGSSSWSPLLPQGRWIPSGPPARFTDEMKGERVARPPGDSLGYYRRAAGKEFTGFAGGAGQNRTV